MMIADGGGGGGGGDDAVHTCTRAGRGAYWGEPHNNRNKGGVRSSVVLSWRSGGGRAYVRRYDMHICIALRTTTRVYL